MKKIILFVVLAIAAIFIIDVMFFSNSDSIYTPATQQPIDNGGIVEYKIKCSPAGFTITYENESGSTEQKELKYSEEWLEYFDGKKGKFVYISAQAENKNATITTEIYYKDKLLKTATSSGDYVIASASGTLP